MNYNTLPSAKLLNEIEKRLTLTTKISGNIAWFTDESRLNPSQPIVTTIYKWFNEKCGAQSTFDSASASLKGIAGWKTTSTDESAAILEGLESVKGLRDSKSIVASRNQCLSSRPLNADYLGSLTKAIQQVLSFFPLTLGTKFGCLMRDELKLTEAHNGIIRVGKPLTVNNTKAREIKFDPSYLKEVDPEGHVLKLIRDVTFTGNNIGKKADDFLSPLLAPCPLDVYQLTASYAVQRRVDDGADWNVIAEEMGLRGVDNLKARIKRYAIANGLNLN